MKEHVIINRNKINSFISSHKYSLRSNCTLYNWKGEQFIKSENIEEVIQYFFVGNAINFCFWNENCYDRYTYKGFTGSAAMWKFIDNPILLNSYYLKNISLLDWEDLERMPLPEKRIEALREVGNVLCDKYDGKAVNICISENWDAEKIVKRVVKEFRCWKDEYNNVKFNKRARLFAVMIYGRFADKKLISNIINFPCLADYQLPKVLHSMGILLYSNELNRMIIEQKEIPYQSKMEYDIRSKTLQAVQMISEELFRDGVLVKPIYLDYYIWNLSHSINEPHHLTKTMAY